MRIILILGLFFLTISLHAQSFPGLKDVIVDTTTVIPTYKYRGTGLTYRTSRDEALSPLVFTGYGSIFSSSTWKYHDKWLRQSSFSSQMVFLENEPASSIMSELGFSYRFSGLKELNSIGKGKWKLWVGPEAEMFLNMRLHSQNVNNVASYDWATAIGGSALLSKKFSLRGRSFAFSNQFHLPLLFLYARPPYAWGIPPSIFEEQKGSWKDAFNFGTLNEVLLFSNQMNFDFHLPKRKKGKLIQYRAYRIAYCWIFFHVRTLNKIQTGGHMLTFSRALSF